MICVAISDKNPDTCLKVLNQVDLAEVRLDLTDYDITTIRKVFAHNTKTIATCRPDTMGLDTQYEKLAAAMESGADYVDIEIEAPRSQQQALIDVAKKNNCRVIISYHNYDSTPDTDELQKIVQQCYELGADVAKLATMSHSKQDNARLLSLYDSDKPLVVLGMGEAGKLTRIASPLLGAEFTFAAMDDGQGTAPGQIAYSEMKELLQLLTRKLGTD